MKYIKKYENTKIIEFDLYEFAQYVGGLHNAIDHLNNIKADRIVLKIDNYMYYDNDGIKKSIVDVGLSNYVKSLEDREAIWIYGSEFSFGFIKANRPAIMKIVGVEYIDETLELFLEMNKYNL